MSGKSIQKLQVIDPSILKSLLEQINTFTKRQTISNTINEPEMNEIIRDYDNYVATPQDSLMKDSLKQNFVTRLTRYKNRRNLRNQPEIVDDQQQQQPNVENPNGGDVDEENGDDRTLETVKKRQSRTVKQFEKRLKTKNIKSSKDGFLITHNGKKTNIPYEAVLNDSGRNIEKKSNFMLSEKEKNRVMRILGDSGFAQYNIPNKKIKTAYGTNQPDLRKYLVEETSPMKKRKKAKYEPSTSGEIPWHKIKRKIYENISDDD